jgi:DsbC/DsbD-like thiol-disulfide interchange protein
MMRCFVLLLLCVGCPKASETYLRADARAPKGGGSVSADIGTKSPQDAAPERVAMSVRWVDMRPDAAPQLVVDLRPIKGWHIYWENPGDSGLPTAFEVRQAGKLLAHRVRMPVPSRKVSPGSIVSYGYEGSTLFFIALEGAHSDRSTLVSARWLACAETCIKGSKTLKVAALAPTQNRAGERELEAWKQLPSRRTIPWRRVGQSLVFMGRKEARIELFPHTELHRRLDGHATSYCSKNRCELPAFVLASDPENQPLWATITVSSASSIESFQTDILKGIEP